MASLLVCHKAAWGQGIPDAQQLPEAKATPEQVIAYKFTPTLHFVTNQPTAYDLNLRANLGEHTAWLGYYQRANEFRQLRVGYSDTFALPFGRLMPSLEYASRGYLGGSVNLEIGERYFGLVGLARTNRKDFFNLSFDPNDAVMIGAGTRALRNTTLSVFQIRDDRLGTGQRVTHVVARVKPDERTRWTVDIFHREGRSPDDDEMVRGTGVAVTYDFDRYFARVASDPHVNFSRNHMLRIAFGFRF